MVDNGYSADEIVMVPVPRRHLPAVYAALGISMNPLGEPGSGVPAGDGVEVVVVRGARKSGRWTEAMVRALEAELDYDRSASTRTLLMMAAERAPRQVNFSEVARAAGVEDNKLRGELGALTKAIGRLFEGETSWPVAVRYTDAGETFYSMEPRLAEWWTNANGIAVR